MQWRHGSSSMQGHGFSPALHVAKSDVAEPVGDKALISMGVNLFIINECCCPDLLRKGSRNVSWGFVWKMPLISSSGKHWLGDDDHPSPALVFRWPRR